MSTPADKGIGGYDLRDNRDLGFAFDYDGSGKLDHLVFYRPGGGACFIIKNNGGSFEPVYAQGMNGGGIGDYDLRDNRDLGFAFDYDGSGKLPDLTLYRPGDGVAWVIAHSATGFDPGWQSETTIPPAPYSLSVSDLTPSSATVSWLYRPRPDELGGDYIYDCADALSDDEVATGVTQGQSALSQWVVWQQDLQLFGHV